MIEQIVVVQALTFATRPGARLCLQVSEFDSVRGKTFEAFKPRFESDHPAAFFVTGKRHGAHCRCAGVVFLSGS
jgi:hypothetical protein